jgi:hypothetical protein
MKIDDFGGAPSGTRIRKSGECRSGCSSGVVAVALGIGLEGLREGHLGHEALQDAS